MGSSQWLELSEREEAVLSLCSAGLTDKEVAASLQISIYTVRTYWDRIKEKAGAATRMEASSRIAEERARLAEENVENLSNEVERYRRRFQKADARQHSLTEITGKLPLMVWAASVEGEIYYVSEGFLRYTGEYPCAGPNWWVPYVAPEHLQLIQSYAEGSRPINETFEFEILLRRHDGAYRWHQVRTMPVAEEDGTVVRRIGSALDVHDLKHLARRLDQTENRLQLICDLAPVGIGYFDPARGRIYSNAAFEELTGFALNAETVHSWINFIHAEDRERVMQSWTGQLGLVGMFESVHRFVRPNGRSVRLKVRAVPIDDGQAGGFIVIVQRASAGAKEGATRERLLQLAAALEEALQVSDVSQN